MFSAVPKKSEAAFPPSLIFISFLGSLLLAVLTKPWGMGLRPDSGCYLSAARGLLNGQGLITPDTWNHTLPLFKEGPLFSLILAALGLADLEPYTGARVFHIFLFGINIFLTGWATYHYSKSRGAALGAAFFVLSSFVTLWNHAMVLSEPTFIFFGLTGILLLALFLDGGSKNYGLFWIAAITLGLAFFTRYAAVSCVAVGVLGNFLLSKKPFPGKIRDSFWMGVVAVLPTALWMLRNHFLVGQSTELSWNFAPYVSDHIRQLFGTISLWLLPKAAPVVLRVVLLFCFLTALSAMTFYLIRQKKLPVNISALLWLYIFSHIVVYFLTTALMAEQSFDHRSLSLVYVAGVIYLFIAGSRLWKNMTSKNLRFVLLLLCFGLGASYAFRAARWGRDVYQNGLGFAARSWRQSQTLQKVKDLPPGTPIYTNGVDAVYLLTGKLSSGIPAKEDVLKVHIPDPNRRLMKNYPAEIEKMKEEMKRLDGVVVYLRGIQWRWYYPSEQELAQSASLRIFEQYPDGAIYKVRE